MYMLKPSFAAGELSPAMYGRTDIAKYDVGAAKLENFIVLRYGGVQNRAGTKYLATTAGNKKAVLLPFRYNVEQNFIIEFTAGKIRFYTQGELVTKDGAPYEISNDYTEEELESLKYTQSADVMFLVQPNHPPATLTRYANDNWTFERMDITGGPFADSELTAESTTTITASATTGEVTLTASADIFTADMVDDLIALTHFVDSDYKKGTPSANGTNLIVSVLPHSSVYVESFGFWDGNFTLEKYDRLTEQWVKIRSQSGNRSQNYNMTEENDSDEITQYRVTSTEFNTDVWSGENEQQRGYITIQAFGNDYTGHVLITGYTSATQVTGTVKKQLASTEATKDYQFASWSQKNGFPTCAGFFEDRLVFAGSKAEPQTFWASKTGDYYNFGTSIPALDNDAITATLNGGQMNGIKAIIAFGEMILLTAGGEYKVTGNGKPITGENVLSQAQEYRGISDVLPVTVGSRIVYLQQQGNLIRDLAYSYDVDKYTGDDLNLLASHLFERHKITSMTYQQTPNSIVWCTRDDGVLLGLTYLKEQDVYAWHQHSTAHGKFINVCAISGPQEDELYCVVEREGNYYVERMVAREASAEPEDQYFVDSGITVSGNTKTNEVTGLDHLEGLKVAILADGNVQPLQTVTDGKITLKRAYSKIHVGLPIHAEMQTLPLEFNAEDGTFMSRKKRVSALMAMFKDSRGGLYGIGDGPKNEFKWRSTEKWGEPIALFTGKKKMPVPQANWNETVMVTISQEDPLPLTILSLVPQIEAGG
jgi:hypothetical protein